jgi:aldehyde:ferredoxin oxidoreductase
MGIDTITLGSTLAFAMELEQKGIKDFGLQFGSPEGISEAIRQISLREGRCAELADGVKRLSQQYGGQEFAIHAKGLEFASYDPRHSIGLGLGYATSNRGGCHLNGGFLTFVEILSPVSVNGLDTKAKPPSLPFFKTPWNQYPVPVPVCLQRFRLFCFSFQRQRSAFHNRLAGRLLTATAPMLGYMMHHPRMLHFKMFYLFPHIEAIELATGMKYTLGSFLEAGERSFTMERMFNIREGFTCADDNLPPRIMHEMVDAQDKTLAEKMDTMLQAYYRVRKWEASAVPADNCWPD